MHGAARCFRIPFQASAMSQMSERVGNSGLLPVGPFDFALPVSAVVPVVTGVSLGRESDDCLPCLTCQKKQIDVIGFISDDVGCKVPRSRISEG